LTEQNVVDATRKGCPSIVITFTESGAKKPGELSEAHAYRPLAILVDEKAIAARPDDPR
jgi:hypothetical protein